jgi:transcription elongation GreA/GreB family factor
MGKGLLGKVIGDVAHVETPNGKLEFVIENISI